MRRIRVYVDTSVFGGTQDERYREASKRFFERVARGDYRLLLSRVTTDELEDAPTQVSKILDDLPPERVEGIVVDEEVHELARAYVEANVLGEASTADALHVAAASVAAADLVLSWNFRHIVNYDRIRGFNSVNVRLGYRSVTILSPMEIRYGDEEGAI